MIYYNQLINFSLTSQKEKIMKIALLTYASMTIITGILYLALIVFPTSPLSTLVIRGTGLEYSKITCIIALFGFFNLMWTEIRYHSRQNHNIK
jgi:hypothetical protein